MPRPRRQEKAWIEQISGSDRWYICWHDDRIKRIRRKSSGERDHGRAQIALAKWIIENDRPTNAPAADVWLAIVMKDYLEQHAVNLPSIEGAMIAADNFTRIFGPVRVADLTLDAQDRYVAARRGEGVADSTISREFSVLRAAINRAHRRGMLAAPVHIMGLGNGRQRERVLTPAEMVRLWQAATATHLKMFIILMMNTASRPDAVLELQRFQVDFDAGLVHLNPAGRKQTKKFRPTLPVTKTLAPWLEGMSGVPAYVHYRGKPLASMKTAFREAVAAAALEGEVIPYTIRHTVATEMRKRGVPPWEVAAWLGHKIVEFKTTERYAHVDPNYLAAARKSVDAYMADLRKLGADLAFRASFAQKPVSRKGRGVRCKGQNP